MTERQRYRAEDLHEFCCAVLKKVNVPQEDAQEVGACLVLADLRGVDSHGVIRLSVYALRIRKNVVNAGAMPRIIRTHAAAALFMTKDEFASRMDILRMLKSSPPAPDTENVLAPGEIERQNEAKNKVLGVPLPPRVIDQLAALGAEVNVGFPNWISQTAAEARP